MAYAAVPDLTQAHPSYRSNFEWMAKCTCCSDPQLEGKGGAEVIERTRVVGLNMGLRSWQMPYLFFAV